MKKLVLTVITLLFIIQANAQQWVYASTMGAVQSAENPTYTAKDASGNLYVASNFSGTRNFNGTPYTAAGIYDAYVVKFDPTGAFVWFRQYGASGAFTTSGGLCTDVSGNIYLAGSFTNQIVIGGSGVSSAGGKDIFIFKLDGAGANVWGKTAGGVSNEEIISISCFGNLLFACGNYSAGYTDGSVTIPAPYGNSDILVASYNTSSGACANMMQWGGTASDVALSISASANSIFVTGSFIGVGTFGTYTLTSANTPPPNPSPTPDMFLAKIDSTLAISWVLKAGAGSTDQGNSVSQDAQGNAYVAGYFLRTVNFGNNVILVENNGYGDGFIVKYNSAGVCQWGNKVSGGLSDVMVSISTDPLGSSYVCGAFGATATLTGSNNTNASLVTSGVNDGFIAKYGSDGIRRWSITSGSSSDDRAQSVIWDANGFCQFVINHAGTITAGSLGTFAAPGGGAFGQLVASYDGLTTGITPVGNTVEMQLYPNPSVNGIVTVQSPSAITYFAVYSVDGRLMYDESTDASKKISFNTAAYSKGTYLVSIVTEKGKATQKLTIE